MHPGDSWDRSQGLLLHGVGPKLAKARSGLTDSSQAKTASPSAYSNVMQTQIHTDGLGSGGVRLGGSFYPDRDKVAPHRIAGYGHGGGRA